MDTDIYTILLYFSAIGSSMNAGLFFIFSNTVMDALGKLKSHEGICAMQQINRVILNPLFFFVFFGTALSSLALIILLFLSGWSHANGQYVLLGSISYLIGCILITITCNVPRNEALDKAEPTSQEGAQLWNKYLKEWTFWNHVRTVACIFAALFFVMACANGLK